MLLQTIKEPTEFLLPSYFGKGENEILITPGTGTRFRINGTELTPETIEGVKHWTTARFLQIQTGVGKVRVIEHLISALRAAGIHTANIECQSGFTPIIGPGIEPVYSTGKLLEKTEFCETLDYTCEQKVEFNEGGSKMIIEPSDTFDVVIDTNHPDLADLGSEPLNIKDVYSSINHNSQARPIARLQSGVVYSAFQVLQGFPFHLRGIGPSSYIMTKPGDNGNDIVLQMNEKYQEGRNEHLYHTMIADFLGELAIFFPGEFKGKITLLNTNHTTRIALLRQLYSFYYMK